MDSDEIRWQRSQAIRLFAAEHGLTDRELSRAPTVQEFLDDQPLNNNFQPIAREIKTFKELEFVFETLLSPYARKSGGIVYTPEYIIDELIRSSLALHKGQPYSIVDPACGSGGFLLRASHLQHEQDNVTAQQLVEERLYGIDVDPLAIQHTKAVLELYLLIRGDNPDCHKNLVCADSLLTPVTDLEAMLGINGGADIVVTNPPYVKVQNLAPEFSGFPTFLF
jgi:type I restriction-modification system DNA methylase subunit